MGGHIQSCPDGHISKIWYNSCKHRHCPQCNQIQVERWLSAKSQLLINTSHRHLVFTIPHQFNELWLMNTRLMTDILFNAVSETMKTLLNDKKYLGADSGFLLNLHTWGRNLSLHPHIHCLVTNGGLTRKGQWIAPVKGCFLPFKVVMRLFRGKFCAAMRSESLRVPESLGQTGFSHMINQLGRADWHVEVMKPYNHGNGVINYLARYVKGGPINNQQISLNEDSIQLKYQSHQSGKTEIQSFSKTGFIRQLLIHVPDKGKRTVRSYGLYTSGKRAALNRAREAHKQQCVVESDTSLSWQAYLVTVGRAAQACCPTCRKPLVIKERFRRGRDPTRHNGS